MKNINPKLVSEDLNINNIIYLQFCVKYSYGLITYGTYLSSFIKIK